MKRIEPAPGQESVWDYPRPPVIEPVGTRVRVVFNGAVIADTTRAYRYLETSHPPSYYIPPEDVAREHLTESRTTTHCEYKGVARYVNVVVGDREVNDAAWFYPSPSAPYSAIADYFAFYPQKMDECTIDGVRVEPQQGGFYGGWITPEIVGPFKGGAGTLGW
ncbi:MAG TPA: DUF427 domain-containing protein [Coriobacteriia bacterium]|nr:DUF427 domain-containing protein [Coriobacteriia bacterium]